MTEDNKAPAKKAAPAKKSAPKKGEDKKGEDKKGEVKGYAVLEVQGTLHGGAALRITEAGAKPLYAGAKLKVHCDLVERLVAQYSPHLKVVEKDKQGVLKNGHYELVSEGNKPKGKPEAGKTAANKSMADKGSDKK